MHALYINLDKRTDRRAEFEEECDKMKLQVERFSAMTHPVPAIGCNRSHLEIIRRAKQEGWPCVFVFEDDFTFLVSREKFDSIVASFPEDYDVVMLDYYMIQKEPYNEIFDRVLEAQSTAGYVVHSRMYDRMIATYEEGVRLYEENPGYHWLYIVDQYWKRLQPVSRWYSSRVQIGKQRPGFSDLRGQYMENVY